MGRCRAFCNGKMVFVVFGKKEWASNQLVRRWRLKYVRVMERGSFWRCSLFFKTCISGAVR